MRDDTFEDPCDCIACARSRMAIDHKKALHIMLPVAGCEWCEDAHERFRAEIEAIAFGLTGNRRMRSRKVLDTYTRSLARRLDQR